MPSHFTAFLSVLRCECYSYNFNELLYMLLVTAQPLAVGGGKIRQFDFRVTQRALERLGCFSREPVDRSASDLKISTVSSSEGFYRTFNTITSFAFDK
jgi:hypothetical protein